MLRFGLDNGMRVVVDGGGATEMAAVYLWVNAGSSAEPPGLEGAAHFLEHMVFKGTRSFGVGEVAAAIEDLGGDLNAFTGFDETVFHATVPGSEAPRAMAVLAEMVREARLDPVELERERQVILEEIRGGQDDPDLVLHEATWAETFPGHAYGRPIIGWEHTVKAMGRDALAAYYAAHYQPANACLAVAGRVDVGAVSEAARRLFAAGGAARPGSPGRATGRAGRKTLRRGFEAHLVDLAFAAPPLGHPDAAAIDVLATALGAGVSAPLESRLRLREELCLGADMVYETEANAGLLVVSLHAREGRAAEAVQAAREELARARGGDVDPRDIDRAKAQIVAERVFGRETVDGRAHAVAFDLERFGDPEAWRAYEVAVLAVTPEAVERVARTWLAAENEGLIALVPDGQAPEIGPDRTSPRPRPRRAPEVREHRLDNGVRILLEPDDGEVVAVRIAGRGGAMVEPEGAAGRTSAWARTVVRGTEDLDAVAFAGEVEALSGGIGASGSRSTQWLRGEFISRTFSTGLELLLDVLNAPAFDPDEIEQVRDEMLAALEEREDEPEVLLGEKLWSLAYGRHPYGRPPAGTPGSVGRIGRGVLAAHHQRWRAGPNLVVGVVGGFDPDRVLARLKRAFGRLPDRWSAPEVAEPVWPTELRRATLRSGREQAHLAVAWAGTRVDAPDQPELEMVATVLGGQGGRLFVELREQHGLAYAVGASSQEGVHPGLVICTMATDPARVEEAERRLLESVDRLRREGAAPAEVDRVRRYLVGGAEADLQTAGSRAASMALGELYGTGGAQYRSVVRRRLEKVDVDAIQRRAALALARPIALARVLPGREEA